MSDSEESVLVKFESSYQYVSDVEGDGGAKDNSVERLGGDKTTKNSGGKVPMKRGFKKFQEKDRLEEEDDKWRLYQIEKFIELYESHPCLWDCKRPEYKNRKAKEDVWQTIVDEMKIKGFTVKKAKKKIRVLRNTYGNELTKIAKSKCSAASPEEVYSPSLRWFPTMDRFLGTVIQTRSCQAFRPPEVCMQEASGSQIPCQKDDNEGIEIEEGEEILLLMSPDNQSNSTRENNHFRPKKVSVSRQQISPYLKPTTKKSVAERFNKIDSSVKELQDMCKKLLNLEYNPVKPPSEYELFGQLVAVQLKKLPERNALAAMKHIQSFLLEERMKVSS